MWICPHSSMSATKSRRSTSSAQRACCCVRARTAPSCPKAYRTSSRRASPSCAGPRTSCSRSSSAATICSRPRTICRWTGNTPGRAPTATSPTRASTATTARRTVRCRSRSARTPTRPPGPELSDYQRDLSVKGKLPFDFDTATLDLSFGGERTERNRDASLRSFSFSAAGPIARDPAVLALPIDQVLSPDHIGEDGFVLSESTLPTDNYFARQDLTAFFLGIDTNIAQKYRIAVGARRERNDQAVTTFSLSNPEAPPVVAGENTSSTLPAAALTWAYSENAQLRASFSKTLSRPDFRELSPAPYLDPLLDVQVVGNPDLVTAGIRNYDLRWEYYFSPVEAFSIGAFLKEFENPIEKTRLPGSGVLLSLDNAQSARNYGIELDVSKGLEFVADWPGFRHIHGDWANWSVGFNYARIKSSITLDPLDASFQTNLERPMQGQSPYVTNLQLGHQAGDGSSEATLLFNVSGRRIAAVGVAGQPDIYEEAFRQLDFQYRHALADDWSFKLRLRNLLDPAVRYTQGDKTTREYRKGRALMLTLEWKPR
ncbi:TonB-dependent receptor domain-containing protein [Tahibacter sp. UC22_41]|uniref:TonB-dependent receptor domain-containing protein n=1 Tax=Tahibacter sp. UC22_41 TaxID=3350178 RepID=UPI0036DD151F